ncbi:MAG TPA: hypothetical protein VHM67_06055 [Gemmatimonadaceae bacterium]|nr:hypothetical protein [Gemmatimonadaceae bacterium]
MTSKTLLALLATATLLTARETRAQLDSTPARSTDPRVGLAGGLDDAREAAWNLRHVVHRPRAEGWYDPDDLGTLRYSSSDLAFRGNVVFQGAFHGLQAWDVSTPADPRRIMALPCPGGQGDVSVHGNLLFMSVEETRGRVDCGTQGIIDTVSSERFRGVRIFDISDVANPRPVALVQTCRGSHTHTLVTDPRDAANVYIYVSGTSRVRSPSELAGCSGRPPEEDPNTSYFRIEVIQVPVAAPQNARIVNMPRIFADSAGAIAGLWQGGTHGEGTQRTAVTNQCHDITVYGEIGLAAGACAGNGILLDVSDPANPRRIDEVSDPNFAYWHSATFSNDGRKVIFTDEWGGGTQPRCRATDRPEWGADAIFSIEMRKMRFRSYYKIPAPQTSAENCVAHNGSLIPVPGRDIMVQGWYQGGISVFDFTDPTKPVEIAFFDRGPVSDTSLVIAGFWAGYWYNGRIYGSEMARGLDIFELQPSEYLTQNEIDAAKLVQVDVLNPQNQKRIVWPAQFVVARAYVDGLMRRDAKRRSWGQGVHAELARAEKGPAAARRTALARLATRLDRDAANAPDAETVRALAGVVRELGTSAR